jgi:hypothetical protein
MVVPSGGRDGSETGEVKLKLIKYWDKNINKEKFKIKITEHRN